MEGEEGVDNRAAREGDRGKCVVFAGKLEWVVVERKVQGGSTAQSGVLLRWVTVDAEVGVGHWEPPCLARARALCGIHTTSHACGTRRAPCSQRIFDALIQDRPGEPRSST